MKDKARDRERKVNYRLQKGTVRFRMRKRRKRE